MNSKVCLDDMVSDKDVKFRIDPPHLIGPV